MTAFIAACGGGSGSDTASLDPGANPDPVELVLPASAPLSAMAQVGKQLFSDTSLSGSGQMSCATCHVAAQHYGPPADSGPIVYGGANLDQPGVRAVPMLEYLYRQPAFSIGPESSTEAEQTASVASQVASASATSSSLVPQGGLFWDGRINTLQEQASVPLFNPIEMAATSTATVAAAIRAASYAPQIEQLLGATAFADDATLVNEAMFAIARYQIEDSSFHPFTSKFDAWLQGKASFTAAELAGYEAFNDPNRGNCAACHLDTPTADRLPPLFTDFQYEALGVPRNRNIPANADASYFDLGVCGPYRTDMTTLTQYCGMFLTPSLRNVSTQHAFFHNGEYQTLQEVLTFYDSRDVAPQDVYPTATDGTVDKFDDLPSAYQSNVDTVDPPFDRALGQSPPMSAEDMSNIIAFLGTLTDGYSSSP